VTSQTSRYRAERRGGLLVLIQDHGAVSVSISISSDPVLDSPTALKRIVSTAVHSLATLHDAFPTLDRNVHA